MSGVEGRLVDIEFIGIDVALDNVFAQPITARNEYDIPKARFRVQRKHHAAGPAIGADHFHDGNRKGDFEMVEIVVVPINDGTIRENGRKTPSAGIFDRVLSAYIDETF